ncbi:phosphoglycerate mutase family protein [Bacillus sp. FJAT-47783]|uniref:histidine phosphatase family protein n=1 Tax=Bacillus sp. FJAT-47783 TaxID=2922712 RepID=UPI001FADA553|nr:phosphoglycerate mutase family protein [Bacillus sp. FJAT-47783]
MEISLIRHGRSKFTENRRISSKEFHDWVKSYDEHGVFEETIYPSLTTEKIQSSNLVITSDLKRAIESAKLLSPKVELISNSLFNETELPLPSVNLKGLKLIPNYWLVVMRSLWLSGYSNGCESLKEAKQRSKKAAQLLVEYAEEHNTVCLVGHGFFNRLLAKELKNMGWEGKRTSAKHWSCMTYSSQK